MKNRNYLRILLVALSLMLLIGAMVGQTVSAEGEGSGDIYSATIVHDDKISIAFAVKATEAELADGTVAVKYTWGEDTAEKTAVYSHPYVSPEGKTPLEGYVWVVTEGVAAYDIGVNANVKSYYNGEVIEERAYSVATYLYNKLYRDGVTGEQKECYEALLAYGAASQAYLDKNEENLVNALDYAYTKNSDVKINGSSSALASEVTLTYIGTAPLTKWVVNGEEIICTGNSCTIDVDGKVEVDVITGQKIIQIGDKSFTAESGKWLYNTQVNNQAAPYASHYNLIIYDKNYTGTFTTNANGVALVFDKYGRLTKIYDGANANDSAGYLYTVTEGSKSADAYTTTFNKSNYATVAFSNLAEGEVLVICPNDGGTNTARNWANSLRGTFESQSPWDSFTNGYVGQVVTISGMSFEALPETEGETVTE